MFLTVVKLNTFFNLTLYSLRNKDASNFCLLIILTRGMEKKIKLGKFLISIQSCTLDRLLNLKFQSGRESNILIIEKEYIYGGKWEVS